MIRTDLNNKGNSGIDFVFDVVQFAAFISDTLVAHTVVPCA